MAGLNYGYSCMKMEEKQILVNGLKINYKITGEGPVVLILHGWRSSLKTWEIVQKSLVFQKYKVCLLDLPGFGKSENPSKPWKVGDYVHFVLKVADKLELKSFFLLGHSFGGRIAVQLSACYSHRVKKLILCGVPAIKSKPSSKQKIISFLVKIAKLIFPSQKTRDIFYSFLGPKDLKKVKGVMRETFKKVVAEDLEPYLGQIKVETLIVWGEKDKMVPLSVAYQIKEKISNSKLVIIPEAGHSIQIEKPQKLAEIITNFLK